MRPEPRARLTHLAALQQLSQEAHEAAQELLDQQGQGGDDYWEYESDRYADCDCEICRPPVSLLREVRMAGGYERYDADTGETYRVPYDYPFMVRGQPKPLGVFDNPEWQTVASFRTREEADSWLARNRESYQKGEYGFALMAIENWNE